ncbi:hypothetical protein MG296_14255, partial [Flavobacteriaceae bacterium TK19130]|nr:hypothetical protein [Thermobacterium salinum]
NTSMNSPVKKNPGINLSADGESNPIPGLPARPFYIIAPSRKRVQIYGAFFLFSKHFFAFFEKNFQLTERQVLSKQKKC